MVGSGGIGKTSLAVAVAELWQQSNHDAAIFIDLTTGKDADQLWIAAATAFEVDTTPSARAQVLRTVRARECLIVLDNCEHIVDAAADLAAAVLKSGEGVRILATSREPLRIQGEWVHRLPPLDFPEGGATITAREALAYSAIELLVERIAETVGGFALTDREAPFAADPLAIDRTTHNLNEHTINVPSGATITVQSGATFTAARGFRLADADDLTILVQVYAEVGPSLGQEKDQAR